MIGRLRRHAWALGIAVVLVAFVLALVLWAMPTGKATDISGISLRPTGSATTSPGGSGSAARSPGAPSSTTRLATGSNDPFPELLLPRTGSRTDINGASDVHRVVLTAASDEPILELRYRVTGGHPKDVHRTEVRSPVRVVTVAHGNGLVAEIGVRAGETATRVSCSISVDGKLRQSHTAKGPFAVAVCIG